jgi:hypothetical protein
LTNLFIERYKKNWRKTMVGNINGNGAIGGSPEVLSEAAAPAPGIREIAEIGNSARGNLSVGYHVANQAALASEQL